MSKLNVRAEVLRIARDSFETDVRGSELIADLGGDSLTHVDALLSLEETFELDVPDEDLATWSTLDDVVAYVEGKIESAPTLPSPETGHGYADGFGGEDPPVAPRVKSERSS